MSIDIPAPLTVGEHAYRAIRADIIFGRLKPEQKLGLERLKEIYDVSVSTLREILGRLGSEGLVLAEGQRGFQVAPVSSGDLREIADLRLLLEQHAIGLSFAAGDLEWEGAVVAAHHKLALLEKQMLAGDKTQAELWKRYDLEFHRALISACGSRALLDIYGAIYDKYLRYLMVALVFRGDVAAREHEQLLACALTRDAARARDILTSHINECVAFAARTGHLDKK
ncbi:GntR family transcriptional regulator [Tardiphaga sp.]|jgi:DNA-binding GntR family transcriptional regulator|uniref:GntR family transcriptional regulator n=1 Tax=Tardiphaga sp. TaxID=1926292 RepID=UPI001988F269|nr:GntR family transcriptional regulator [Tardiphaga sp.]MBC7580708.1 GntR family transcriptional regulator [Tardiphaga sp.]